MELDLFEPEEPRWEELCEGAWLFHRGAIERETLLLEALRRVSEQAPLRHMVTPGGHRMSVAMTSCGQVGWVTDRKGYRYSPLDPESGQPWPAMPAVLRALASEAAQAAGFSSFTPDTCLINRYQPAAKMGLHQDKDETDFSQPIVSLSLGLPAVFQLGGLQRSDKVQKITLSHGDIVVWGGPSRLRYHGIMPLKPGCHPRLGEFRWNLTFRKAL